MGEFGPMLLVKLLLGRAFLLSAVFLLFLDEVFFGVLFPSIYRIFNEWTEFRAPKLAKYTAITELASA